jgi:hypothetical protein
MKRLFVILLAFLLLQASLLWAGGSGNPEVKKVVVIDDAQAAALTNQTERLLQDVRLPQVEFRQANIADILLFLNTASREFAKTEEARKITIGIEPDAQKELMKYEDYGNNSGGLVHVFTFSGLDMSVLEAVQVLQRVAQLDRRVEGQKLILSMKKKKTHVQQTSTGDSSTNGAALKTPTK